MIGVNGKGAAPRRLRVNYITPAPNLAGGTKSTRLICEAMVRRGHDVRLIYAAKARAMPPVWRVRSFAKVAWKRINAPKEHHLMGSTAQLMPVQKRELEAADIPDADVTIASWWKCMEWVERFPASKGVQVHYLRGHEIWLEPERVTRLYRSPCLKVANSHWLASIMRSDYGRDAEVVHNGIDRQQFDAPLRERSESGCVGFVYSGLKVKDAPTALTALRLVQEEMPNLRVVSFGIKAPPEGTELPRNFTFRETPKQSEIADIYRSTDCWIIPSKSEGLPMPGLEAAACRCPVVATRCGGTTDYVRDGQNGYLVPIAEPRAMADRLLDVLRASKQQWRELSDASYAISQEFDWDLSAEKLERVLLRWVALSEAGQLVKAE